MRHIVPCPFMLMQPYNTRATATTILVTVAVHVKYTWICKREVTCGAMRSTCLTSPLIRASPACRLHLTSLHFENQKICVCLEVFLPLQPGTVQTHFIFRGSARPVLFKHSLHTPLLLASAHVWSPSCDRTRTATFHLRLHRHAIFSWFDLLHPEIAHFQLLCVVSLHTLQGLDVFCNTHLCLCTFASCPREETM